MSIRSFLVCAAGLTSTFGSVYSPAVTVVAAQDYGLQVSQKSLVQPQLKSGENGTLLQLSVANRGTHDLYDVRIYLHQVGSTVLLDRQEPARLTALPAGATSTLQWTYDSKRAPSSVLATKALGPLREVVYRIEAVDKVTHQIVKIYQKGTEAH